MHCKREEEKAWGRGKVWVQPLCRQTPVYPCWRETDAMHAEQNRHAWLMSLVHADFSCREEATRITVNDWPSLGSTTILKSRCSMSCTPLSGLALGKTKTEVNRRNGSLLWHKWEVYCTYCKKRWTLQGVYSINQIVTLHLVPYLTLCIQESYIIQHCIYAPYFSEVGLKHCGAYTHHLSPRGLPEECSQ